MHDFRLKKYQESNLTPQNFTLKDLDLKEQTNHNNDNDSMQEKYLKNWIDKQNKNQSDIQVDIKPKKIQTPPPFNFQLKEEKLEPRKKIKNKNKISLLREEKKPSHQSLLDKITEEESQKINKFIYTGNILRKIAKLCLILSQEQVSEIFKYLSTLEIETITREMLQIKSINKAEARKIYIDFHDYFKNYEKKEKEGPKAVKAMLVKAFGEKKARTIMRKSIPDHFHKPFEFLNRVENDQIWNLIKTQHPSAIAMILHFLDKKKVIKILEFIPIDLKKSIISKMAYEREFNQEIIEQTEHSIKEKLKIEGKQKTYSTDGKQILANILKHLDEEKEESILTLMDLKEPQLKEEIEEKMFNIDIILQISDDHMHLLLNDMRNEKIALFLKGKDFEIREKILSNISKRRQKLIEEEIEFLGKVPRNDVEKMNEEFLNLIKEKKETNSIIILKKNEKVY